jgi:DNA-binding SARP family transcriptional activator
MMQTSAPVTIRLCGEPEVEAHGDSLALKSLKARALLFYLAITAQAHTRNHLASLLWSESPTDSARRSLRAALFQLRRRCGPPTSAICSPARTICCVSSRPMLSVM